MSKQAIVLIGIPGSMKSTLAQQFQSKGWSVVSTDYIRQKLWGDENVQGDWALIEREINAFLALGEPNVVIDATHFRAKFRRNTCDKLQSFGYHAISGLFLNEPLSGCLERNALRKRIVPIEDITHMATVLKQNPPALKDGFNQLITLNWQTNAFYVVKIENHLSNAMRFTLDWATT